MVDLQTLYHDGLVTIEFIDGAADNETKSGSCVAIRYGAKEKPTSGNSGEFHAAPAEGTA